MDYNFRYASTKFLKCFFDALARIHKQNLHDINYMHFYCNGNCFCHIKRNDGYSNNHLQGQPLIFQGAHCILLNALMGWRRLYFSRRLQ